MQIYIRAYCSPQNHSGSSCLYSAGNGWATLSCCHFFNPEPLIHTQSPSTVNKTENICENFMTSLKFVVWLLQPDSETDSGLTKGGLRFQHWTAPKILQSNNRITKRLWNAVAEESGGAAVLGGNLEPELPGRFPPDKTPLLIPRTPTRLPWAPEIQRGLDKPANQSPSAFSLGGTNAAHQANH